MKYIRGEIRNRSKEFIMLWNPMLQKDCLVFYTLEGRTFQSICLLSPCCTCLSRLLSKCPSSAPPNFWGIEQAPFQWVSWIPKASHWEQQWGASLLVRWFSAMVALVHSIQLHLQWHISSSQDTEPALQDVSLCIPVITSPPHFSRRLTRVATMAY